MKKIHSTVFAALALLVWIAPNMQMEKTDLGFQKVGDSRIHNCPPGKVYNQQTKTCK